MLPYLSVRAWTRRFTRAEGGLEMKRMKAAMLDAGITNFSGETPSEGELPSGAPHPFVKFGGQS